MFVARIFEVNGSFGIIALTFHFHHFSQTETFMLDQLSRLHSHDGKWPGASLG